MNVNEQVRQGDVFVEKISALPKGLKKKDDNLLLRGEAADHGHFIVSEDMNNVQVFEDENGELYLEIKDPSKLLHANVFTMEHAEHEDISLDPGFYHVSGQQEYNPYKKEARRVID